MQRVILWTHQVPGSSRPEKKRNIPRNRRRKAKSKSFSSKTTTTATATPSPRPMIKSCRIRGGAWRWCTITSEWTTASSLRHQHPFGTRIPPVTWLAPVTVYCIRDLMKMTSTALLQVRVQNDTQGEFFTILAIIHWEKCDVFLVVFFFFRTFSIRSSPTSVWFYLTGLLVLFTSSSCKHLPRVATVLVFSRDFLLELNQSRRHGGLWYVYPPNQCSKPPQIAIWNTTN